MADVEAAWGEEEEEEARGMGRALLITTTTSSPACQLQVEIADQIQMTPRVQAIKFEIRSPCPHSPTAAIPCDDLAFSTLMHSAMSPPELSMTCVVNDCLEN